MRLGLAVLVLVGSAAVAADCPVSLKAEYWLGTGCKGDARCVELQLDNGTEKKIEGVKVGIQFIDAVGDPHDSLFEYTSTDSTKPGKKHGYVWRVPRFEHDRSNNYIGWIEKMKFEDGSTWEDDGSRQCSARFGN